MAIVAYMRCSGMRGYGYQKRLYADLWWRNSLSSAVTVVVATTHIAEKSDRLRITFIARDFKAEQPNQKWLTDITEFQLPAGKVWLSPVVDCFDGKVISWSLSTRPDAELVNTMLDSAVETLNAGERPVIHSDRGGHYRWPGWLERVNAAGLIRSMSRKGCSPDNAACEGFFGRLKTEMYYGRKWSGITPEKFMQHVDAYIRWYNERRIKLSLGAVSPEMYRQQCGLE